MIFYITDLGLFSTKSLVEANADHPVEVRTQVTKYTLMILMQSMNSGFNCTDNQCYKEKKY